MLMKGKQRLTSYETKQRRTPPENLTCAMELEQKKTFLIAGNNEIENKIEKKVWELHKERGEKNSHLAQIATNYFRSAFC